eukprot:snap_masked-scaffold_8-processed-gene-4.23-mRNA-1 protein AED:1.00 eAED:1.00 QI:0/-1/0/0/-1/1/1/0/437
MRKPKRNIEYVNQSTLFGVAPSPPLMTPSEPSPSESVFAPMEYYYQNARSENELPVLPVPKANENLLEQVELRPLLQISFKKTAIALGILLLLMLNFFGFVMYSSPQQEVGANPPVDGNTTLCTPEDRLRSSKLLSENYEELSSGTIQFSDLVLPCLALEPIQDIILNIPSANLIFRNVEIEIIEENAFGIDNSITERIEFENSKIGMFYNQVVQVEKVEFRNTEVEKYPGVFPVSNLYFFGLINVNFSADVVSFITSSPKETLYFWDVFDDEKIIQFDKMLQMGNKAIELTLSDGTLVIADNLFKMFPRNFFSTERFKFSESDTSIQLHQNHQLIMLDDDLFYDIQSSNVYLTINYCDLLENLPSSIIKLDLYYLDIGRTNISTFEGIDFSNFNNLEGIYLLNTPIRPPCAELDNFRLDYNINEEVDINSCIEEEV